MVAKASHFLKWCVAEHPTLARMALNESFRQAVCHLSNQGDQAGIEGRWNNDRIHPFYVSAAWGTE